MSREAAVAVLFALVISCGGTAGVIPSSASSTSQATTASSSPNSNDQALIDAAKKEGTLTLYFGPSQAALEDITKAFSARYGVTISGVRLQTGALKQRVDAETQSGQVQADVLLSGGIADLDAWSPKGVFAKLPVVPGYKADGEYHTAVTVIGQGMAYNTNALKATDLKTWADFLDPRLKGRIALGSPRIGPAYSKGYYILLHDPNYGRQFFEKLAAQRPRVVQSDPTEAVQLLAAGEVDAAFIIVPYHVTAFTANAPSAPVAFKYLEQSVIIHSDIAIMARAPRPHAAELFARWMMTQEGQTALNQGNRASAPIGDIKGTFQLPPKEIQRDPSDTTTAAEWNAIIAMFDSLYK